MVSSKRGVFDRASNLPVPVVVGLFVVAYILGSIGTGPFRSGIKENWRTYDLGQLVRLGYFRQEGCENVEDYIEDGNYGSTTEDAWRQMKWGLPPAKCRVKGHLIERLDPDYNFRRGVALKFSEDLDDKTHIEQWFLGTKVDLNERKRRVYIDLGANIFNTSVLWFQERYPCDFTEVHAFEVESDLFNLPEGFDEKSNLKPGEGVVRTQGKNGDIPEWLEKFIKIRSRNGGIPKWMVERIHVYNKFVGIKDDEEKNLINVTRFIKDELKLTEHDAVVVKMDIENAEWSILESWMKDPNMHKIVDELWVEVHFYHPDNNWGHFSDHTREQANRLLAEMRFRGYYVHYWD